MRLPLLLMMLAADSARADEWWGWTMLELHRTETTNTGLFLGNRLDADDGAYVQIISPRHKQRVLPWLDMGAGLSLLEIENLSEGGRFLQFRPELEINPHLDLTPRLRLDLRNRMEWRWNEREEITIHRSRHRLQLGWKTPDGTGPLARVFASNEWLSDLHRGQWWENRAVPLGLTFETSKHTELDLFYMIFSVRQQATWRHESVLGTYLRVRF
ncbi:MAG TPA: hypothetical protein DIT64_10335 [Verrucomicrobiales bacterium]|nr:hypothetical protein [Verrucomicrobiales bacterium]